MMDRTIVVAIGIEQYADDVSAPPLRTAGPDAIGMARQLQQAGVPGQQTFLFVQPVARSATEQAAFEQLIAGLKPATTLKRSCTYETIENFWRRDLRDIVARTGAERLFFYWCGHGFTEGASGLPYLAYHDWSEHLPTRVLDRVNLLETLHSADYAMLRSQLFVFDACANVRTTFVGTGSMPAAWDGTIDQMSIAGAARGHYAHGDDQGGRFTRLMRAVLEQHGWDDLDTFKQALETAIRAQGEQSTPVFYRRGRGDDQLWRRANTARDTLVRQLENLDVAPTVYRPLYLTVVSSLAVSPGRGAGTTVAQMIDDLWNANGSAAAARAPYPVVEFVTRVRSTLAKAAMLDAWLRDDRFVAPADRAEAETLLQEEEASLYLVVELYEAKSAVRPGEIERCTALLLMKDHARTVEPWTAEDVTVQSWEDLESKLRPIIARARAIADERGASLTVEFVTNVFDIEPHRLLLDAGAYDVLGEQHPVTLRLRTPRSRDLRQPWLQKAEAIRQGKIATQIHGVQVSNATLQACCVLFIRHPLPPGSRPRHPQPLSAEWQLVRRAINAGVPFICWPLRQRSAADCSDFERELATWVNESRPVDRVPARVREERSAGSLAADVNVFWDDPLLTWQLREIRLG
jgi:hypothetical protein